jgi:hypothetical protein
MKFSFRRGGNKPVTIAIDGIAVGTLAPKETVEVAVEPGHHTLRLGQGTRFGKEDTPMTDQTGPHDQHDSELQLVLTIGIEGFRELVAWVSEGATAEDRHARGSQVRLVIDDVVKNVDSAKINQALLDEAERLRTEA